MTIFKVNLPTAICHLVVSCVTPSVLYVWYKWLFMDPIHFQNYIKNWNYRFSWFESYKSHWVVCSSDSQKDILGSIHNDFCGWLLFVILSFKKILNPIINDMVREKMHVDVCVVPYSSMKPIFNRITIIHATAGMNSLLNWTISFLQGWT